MLELLGDAGIVGIGALMTSINYLVLSMRIANAATKSTDFVFEEILLGPILSFKKCGICSPNG